MSDFIRIITHARRFKSAVKDIGIEQLEEIKTKLEKIISDRIAEEEALVRENAERLGKIQEYQKKLAADGIDPSELQDQGGELTRKRPSRPPKYEIYGQSGERITWTGQGRMPNIFKSRLEEGESMDTFLIE